MTRIRFRSTTQRRGKLWVHGAFEPATGQATLVVSAARDNASHIQLLEALLRNSPAHRWLIVEDNLVTHTSRQVKLTLAAWPEVRIQFIPKYTCWPNLIEPWGKPPR